MKKSHLILLGALSLFSCKKDNNPAPATDPYEPVVGAPLSKSDASSSLQTGNTQVAQIRADFKNTTTVTATALNNLSTLSNSSSSFVLSIGNLRVEDNPDDKNLNKLIVALGNIGLSTPSLTGARIPGDFNAAKGIWVYTVDGYYGEFVKTGPSDKIVIKFPSTYYSPYSGNTPPENDAVYTISKFERTPVFYNSCYGGSVVDTVAIALDAEMTIKGEKTFNVSYAATYQNNILTSTNGKYVIKNYEYTATSSLVDKRYKSERMWKKDGAIVSNNYYDTESLVALTNDINCENTLYNYYYGKIKYYNAFNRLGNLKLSLKIADTAPLHSELKSKYNLTSLDNLTLDQYKSINSDSTIEDKYFKYALTRLPDNAKIGDVITRKFTDSYGFLYTEYYIIYNDGSRQPLKEAFPQFYR